MDEPKQDTGRLRIWHLVLATALQLITFLLVLGVIYGTMRTQIDDDRSTIQELKNTNTDLEREINELGQAVYTMQGQLKAALHLQ